MFLKGQTINRMILVLRKSCNETDKFDRSMSSPVLPPDADNGQVAARKRWFRTPI